MNVRYACRSGVGARTRNEDDWRAGEAGPLVHAVLSDGAGGHRDGALASDLCVRMVQRDLQRAEQLEPQWLHQAMHDAHELLLAQQAGLADLERMHATLVALWIDAARGLALWSHVGDSRLYLLRAGRVEHVTRDDSVVQRMIDAGVLTARAARSHPHRHHLACAVGVQTDFVAHTLERPFLLTDGDAFLLCSDGWWDELDVERIERTYGEALDPDDWLARMEAVIRSVARPDQDNHTAIAVWVGDLPTRAGVPLLLAAPAGDAAAPGGAVG